ncbi:MAG: HAMP domain-containing histidine kinase [Endomicrobium sp.]|nr:HAMP domain-containing histidine kinase [Endomicrobium sp.]
MNNLSIKIFILAAAFFAVLSAVSSGTLHQFFGLLSGTVCFAAFLILFFCTNSEKQGSFESISAVKKHKTYDNKETFSPEYVSNAQEAKQEASQFKTMNISGDFRQKREEEFAREEIMNEKIKLLNKFASVASHDLKNPLSSMKNIAYYFTNLFKIEGETPNKMLKMLSSEVNRMNDMITELLDSTRVKQLNKEKNDLDSIINAAAEKQKDEKYVFDINLQKIQIYADNERMKQVFSVIIQNAKESMCDGGTVTIKSYEHANEAYVEISDTGTGMDTETLAHCFDPMFSTKQARALGMSLTVAKQIVTMHGGIIRIESVQEKGSKFTVSLPLCT